MVINELRHGYYLEDWSIGSPPAGATLQFLSLLGLAFRASFDRAEDVLHLPCTHRTGNSLHILSAIIGHIHIEH